MSVDDIRPVPTTFLDFTNTASFFFALGGPLGVSLSTPLTADATFTVGLDIDGDGDSDVFDPEAEGVDVCTDVDGDGDIEYPAGDYAAGTILDNDVFFAADVLWETTPTATWFDTLNHQPDLSRRWFTINYVPVGCDNQPSC